MNMTGWMTRLLAICVALTVAVSGGPGRAAPLDFDFVLTSGSDPSRFATGRVTGLSNNATGTAASLQFLTVQGAGFPVSAFPGFPPFAPTSNNFTVTNNVITSVDYRSSSGAAAPFTCCTFALFDFSSSPTGFSFDLSTIGLGTLLSGNASFSLVSPPPPNQAPIPLPAGMWLLLTALAALGLARRDIGLLTKRV